MSDPHTRQQAVRRLAAATVLLLAAALPSAAQGVATTPGTASAMAQGQAAAVAKARADSARYPYTAGDVSFMSGMIHHHAQAIVMAKMAPSHGASPAVHTLCDRIINAQQDEITAMQRWLRDRNQTVPEATAGGMKMVMNGMMHDMLMPGMLSEAQMKSLDEARGAAFDRQFLSGMIQHHKGAVSMVSDLFNTYGAAQDELTFKFASDVQVDQTTEINRMQRMLFMMELEGH
ncbi:MAG: DUF305 domain-containing protein [Polaromonas sp.]|nr:DUF305 domain-containing protein [Gemmatimonadaceae bacterium]